jgi:hypothetical protein
VYYCTTKSDPTYYPLQCTCTYVPNNIGGSSLLQLYIQSALLRTVWYCCSILPIKFVQAHRIASSIIPPHMCPGAVDIHTANPLPIGHKKDTLSSQTPSVLDCGKQLKCQKNNWTGESRDCIFLHLDGKFIFRISTKRQNTVHIKTLLRLSLSVFIHSHLPLFTKLIYFTHSSLAHADIFLQRYYLL